MSAPGVQPPDPALTFVSTQSWVIELQPENAQAHLTRIFDATGRGDVDGALRAAREVPVPDRGATAQGLASLARGLYIRLALHLGREDVETLRRSVLAYWAAVVELADDGAVAGRALGWLWQGGAAMDLDAVRVPLADHPPRWRREFGRALAVRRDAHLWRVARALAAEDLLPAPGDLEPLAILQLDWRDLPAARREDPLVGAALDELWTTPDAGRSLGATYFADQLGNPRLDIPPDRSQHTDAEWAGLFEAWGATDPRRRPAVLDSCLAALGGAAGDRASALRGWALVHGRLEVSVPEAEARQSTYLALASGGESPASAVGRAELSRVVAAGLLESDAFLDAAPDALLRPEKGAVGEFLALLTSAVTSGAVDPESAASVLRSVVDQLPRGIDSRARRLLASWEPSGKAAEPAGEPWSPPVPVDLPEPGAVDPLTSVDDLADVLLEVLHHPGHPIDVERAVDGMMRLRCPSPSMAVHLRRAGEWDRAGLARGLTGLVARWLGGDPPAFTYGVRRRVLSWYDEADIPPGVDVRHELRDDGWARGEDGVVRPVARSVWVGGWDETCWVPYHLVGARLAELEPLTRGEPVGSLALPTGRHGGLDATTLVRRLRDRMNAGRPPGPRELSAAALRVEPGDREPILASEELPDRLRAQLSSLSRIPDVEQVVAEPWVYRWQYRSTPGPLVLWQPTGQDAPDGPSADGDDPVLRWLDTRSVVDNWTDHRGSAGFLGGDGEYAGWLLELPWHPDVAATHLQPEVVSSNEQPDADLSGLLSVMAERRIPLGPQATDLLCWAGTYKNPRTRAAASDAIATAARHGMLDGSELGRSVLRLTGPDAGPFLTSSYHLEPEPPKLSRIAATLADTARIDQYGECAVLGAVVACLPALGAMRGSVALLEIAAGIAERRGVRVELPEPLASLAAGRARSRLAEEARRLSGEGRTATLWSPIGRR